MGSSQSKGKQHRSPQGLRGLDMRLVGEQAGWELIRLGLAAHQRAELDGGDNNLDIASYIVTWGRVPYICGASTYLIPLQ